MTGGFQAKVIEDSHAMNGVRLITMQLRYPRFVHAEFMTHRVFSRNASSSRAIPVAKMIDQVRTAPAMPVHWGKNQPGMQARAELDSKEYGIAIALWRKAAAEAAAIAGYMNELGLHKQVANRILEPFQFISVIVTATEWDNFLALRDHPDADPNIALLARMMRVAQDASSPRTIFEERNVSWGWHLPYVTHMEREQFYEEPRMLAQVSAARCARVSYLTHDGLQPDMAKDVELYERLVGGRPMHASPVEHQAFPMLTPRWDKNFRGWKQHRSLVELEMWTQLGCPTDLPL